MTFVASGLLAEVKNVSHGFGTFDQSVPNIFDDLWDARKPSWKQVHGTALAEVVKENQVCGEVDGLVTPTSNIPIGIFTADCVPILLARRDGSIVAAIHSGWRGTRAMILRKFWSEMSARGEEPRNWVAAIGPAIEPCCYEVSEEMAKDFEQHFAYLENTNLKNKTGKSLAVPEFRRLDLQRIQQEELRQIGFYEVDLIRMCTRCNTSPRFASYRRSQKIPEESGRQQLSGIMIKK